MPDHIPSSEITPRDVYLNRRTFMRAGVLAATRCGHGRALSHSSMARGPAADGDCRRSPGPGHGATRARLLGRRGRSRPRASIVNYNNFYEFTTDKDGVAAAAAGFTTDGWKVAVGGLVPQAAVVRPRRPPQAQPARGAGLSHALRRGLVDGDPVGRVLAVEAARRGRADGRREVRRVRDAARSRADARTRRRACSTGRTSRACGSTRRCTR